MQSTNATRGKCLEAVELMPGGLGGCCVASIQARGIQCKLEHDAVSGDKLEASCYTAKLAGNGVGNVSEHTPAYVPTWAI